MPRKVACSCGKRFVLRDDQLGKSIRCPGCGAALAATREASAEAVPTRPAPPSSGASGPEALAALFNNMSPRGARKFAAALNASGPAKGKPHRYGTLGCALPLGLLFCASFTALFVMPGEPPPLPAYFFVGGLAVVLIVFSVWRMWGFWTRGRVVWSACLTGLFALGILIAAMRGREEKDLSKKFSPVVQALGDVGSLQDSLSAGLRPKVVPVVLTKKGAKKADAKTPPEVAFDLYQNLPEAWKAGGPGEVQTVVLLDYGWNYWGTYRNQITGNTGNAYVGTCGVTVVDWKSRLVVARETLQSPEKPPESKLTAMEWYGSQPSEEQIVKYLQGLPVRYSDLPPPPPDDKEKTDPAAKPADDKN
jgi:hypothetical protein